MRHSFAVGLGVGIVSIGSIWGVALLAALPTTVLDAHATSGGRSAVSTLVPQGWSFFTRDPQTSSLVVYGVGPGGRFTPAGTLPQTRGQNLGGLSRNQRSEDTEKSLLATSIREWTACDHESFETCAEKALLLPAEALTSDATVPNFCGEHLLVLQAVTPFAFRHAAAADIHAEQMARIDIDCEGR